MAFTNQTVAVHKIMEYFYQVPDYQRGYVWDQDRVTDFLQSIIEHFKGGASTNYFIGAAVFEASEAQGNKYYVVDGQQRLSTIFIIICAAHTLLKRLDAPSDTLTAIADEYLRKYNRKEKNAELKIQHSDRDCAIAFADILDDRGETPTNASRSAENIYVAYREALKYLSKEFVELEAELEDQERRKESIISSIEDFVDRFEKVTMLPFISQSKEESLTVFETLNSKGVGLSNLDILKSVLFDSIREDDEEWEKLTKKWNEFLQIFEPLKVAPNKFLRYTVVTQFGENKPAAKCLQWIRENSSVTKISEDPKFFISKMHKTAQAIHLIRSGMGPDKNKNFYLMNMRRLSPSAEQQYFLLIPLWDSEKRIFNEACLISEAVIFLNKMLAHYTGSTEKNFIDWGKRLSGFGKDCDAALAFAQDEIWPVLRREKQKIESVLSSVTWNNTNRALVGWILKRCEVFAAEINRDETREGVDTYLNVDIEHIAPQSSTDLSEGQIHSLGNLTIQEKGFNRANGSRPFADKLPIYSKSQYKMTNALTGIPEIGGNSKKAYDLFYSATEWGALQIMERTTKIVKTLLTALKL